MKFECDICKKLISIGELIITTEASFNGALSFYHEKCWKKNKENNDN